MSEDVRLFMYFFLGFWAVVFIAGGIIEAVHAHRERKAAKLRRERIREKFVAQMAVLDLNNWMK